MAVELSCCGGRYPGNLARFAAQQVRGRLEREGNLVRIRVEDLTNALRVLTVGVPIVAWIVTYRLLVERAGRTERRPAAPRTVVLRRTAAGGFDEVEDA